MGLNRYSKKPSSAIYTVVLSMLVMIFSFARVQAQLPDQFQQVELLTGLTNAISLEFSPDGRAFLIDRYGDILIYDLNNQTVKNAGSIDVFTDVEDGLLDIAFDPDFLNNNFVYIHYSATDASVNRVSRFTMDGNSLDLNSEIAMLEWPVQRVGGFHAAGDMKFDSQGNLYIATGDNSDHGKWFAGSETQEFKSAEKSSGNTNDLRGKILRIKPQSDGSYTIPGGNLFPGGVGGKPEIYVMGARNPFKIHIDEQTDWLFWGEVGPDANVPGVEGPVGMDEINLTKAAGNFGWPHFAGKNEPYLNTYANPTFYFDPAAPVNLSTWNTGATNLPPAEGSWLEFFHECYLAGPRYYYNPDLTDQQRLPIEYDGLFFYYDFNTSQVWAVQMDANGDIINNEQVAPSLFGVSTKGFIDMEVGPDGHLYILEYGAGCCPDNVGTGKLVRLDYIGIISNSSPVVTVSADPDNGPLNLMVNFSSAGTYDPDGDNLTYEWDFQTDGNVDSTDPNPTFTYTSAGVYNVQLRVSDGNGGVNTKNLTIHAGNSAPTFTILSIPDGGLIQWGDDVSFNIIVEDAEDGSTQSGGIDCSDVTVVPALGHLTHFHDGLNINDCSGTITVATDHDIYGEDDIFYVLGVNYTDNDGLTAFDQVKIHPKRKEAEFYTQGSDVSLVNNSDIWGGGLSSVRANDGSWIMLEGRNLQGINIVKYRVATTASNGEIEIRLDSINGPLLTSTNVPNTGGYDQWTTAASSLTDPGGKHDLYFLFKSNTQSVNIFDVNWIQFDGVGAGIDNSPPSIESITVIDGTNVRVTFNELLNQSSAVMTSNYSINNGINVTNAALMPDERTVILTVSDLIPGLEYTISINGVKNLAGLSIVNFSDQIRLDPGNLINAGGPEVIYGNEQFVADDHFSGGTAYAKNTQAISGTTRQELYQTERFGTMSYNVPVGYVGKFDVRLHFAEIYYGVGSVAGGPGDRVFDILLEGVKVEEDFDILTEVAPATALIKEYSGIQVSDGFLSIDFQAKVDNPKISAIEILEAGSIQPQPSIQITSPAGNSSVANPFNISFFVQNWVVAEGGDHVHVFVDGEHYLSHYSLDPVTIDNLPTGPHTIRMELFRAGHTGTGVDDEVLVNVVDQGSCVDNPFPLTWSGYDIGTTQPQRGYQQIPYYDLDGDNYPDVAMGQYWYKNPGTPDGNWQQNTIGEILQVFYALDFDNDGDIDLLGNRGTLEFVWAENDGNGNFTPRFNIESGSAISTDFLSDFTGGVFNPGGPHQIAITWNGGEKGNSDVQMITIPSDPVNTTWTVETIHPTSEGEGIASGDIDGDGDLDLFQGFHWLRNDGSSWQIFDTGLTFTSHVDRVDLADFDGDGDLDGVVGQIGTNREFVWLEVTGDPEQPWVKHVLDPSVDGILSMNLVDMDNDGDLDILAGEWRGSENAFAFENDLCNSGTFIKHILNTGIIDHHNGMHPVDVDLDGDLDIVTMGWLTYAAKVLVNDSDGTPPPPDGDWELRINSGGAAYTDSNGDNWVGDQHHDNGRTYSKELDIAGTTDDILYHSERHSRTGTLNYSIPVPSNGNYTVKLHFAEIYFGAPGGGSGGVGSRVFNINVDGQQTVNNFDIVQAAGASATAFIQTFTGVNVTDGTLDLELVAIIENPKISGIEIIAEDGGGPSPLPPVVNIGSDKTITLPVNTTSFTATASDPDGGNIVSYAWTKVSGPNATLAGDDTQTLNLSDLVEGTYIFSVLVTDDEGQTGTDQVTLIVLPESVGSGWSLYVNAGGNAYSDSNGNDWTADQYSLNGREYSKNVAIAGTTDDIIFQSERHSRTGTLNYSIPVPADGNYTVKLHFAEIYFGAPGGGSGGVGSRIFNIDIENGQRTTNNFDIVSAAGGSATATIQTYTGVTVTDGNLDIELASVVENPKISGIEILAESGGGPTTLPPVVEAGANKSITLPVNTSSFTAVASDPDGGSIVSYAWTKVSGPTATLAGENTQTLSLSGLVEGVYTFSVLVTDDEGETATDQVTLTVLPGSSGAWALWINSGGSTLSANGEDWEADQSFINGRTYTRGISIANAVNVPVYQTERHSRTGTLDYSIPVPANGMYIVSLHFAEIYFGTAGKPGGAGSRIFNVEIEGNSVLSNYDIIVAAGGTATAVIETFNIDVTDGFLDISLIGVEENPKISGIHLTTGTAAIPPVANAGEDQTIALPINSVSLSGTGQDNDGNVVSYAWQKVSGGTAIIESPNSANTNISSLEEGSYTFSLTVTDDDGLTDSDNVNITVNSAGQLWASRINAGGSAFTFNGEDWMADAGFVGGNTYTKTVPIGGSENDLMYQTERFHKTGDLQYNIPVPNDASFTVILHYAELYFTDPGQRVFSVSLEGDVVEPSFDVIVQAGGKFEAHQVAYTGVTVSDGTLNILLGKITENPKINGIEVLAESSPSVINTSNIPEPGSSQTRVYPNPFKDTFKINVDNNINVFGLRIYDMKGNEVYRGYNKSNLIPVDLTGQSSGLYQIMLWTSEGLKSLVIIKE